MSEENEPCVCDKRHSSWAPFRIMPFYLMDPGSIRRSEMSKETHARGGCRRWRLRTLSLPQVRYLFHNCGGPGYAFNRSDVAIELFPTSEWLHGVVLAGVVRSRAAESAVDASMQSPNRE